MSHYLMSVWPGVAVDFAVAGLDRSGDRKYQVDNQEGGEQQRDEGQGNGENMRL